MNLPAEVLLLDDDPVVRSVAEAWFDGGRGIAVRATGCPQAFAGMAGWPVWAAVVMDYRLPDGRTGCEILGALPDLAVPVVIWTAVPEEAKADLRCRSSRILDVIEKPDLAELEYRLRIVLASLEIEREVTGRVAATA